MAFDWVWGNCGRSQGNQLQNPWKRDVFLFVLTIPVIPSHLAPRGLAIFSNQFDATQEAGTEPGSLGSQLDRQQIVFFGLSHSFQGVGGCLFALARARVKKNEWKIPK